MVMPHYVDGGWLDCHLKFHADDESTRIKDAFAKAYGQCPGCGEIKFPATFVQEDHVPIRKECLK